MDWKLLVILLAIFHGLKADQLGRPFSILYGLKPVLPAQEDFSSVFYPVKKSQLFRTIQRVAVKNENQNFSNFVHLTYHPDEKDLIKTFFSIWQFEDETRDAGPFTYQPGSSTSQKETYATLLGISSENLVGKSYVLARYIKKVKSLRLTEAHFSNLNDSAVSPDSSSDKIAELFANHGTHYLSGYDMGDMIYQVFVYDKEKTDDILRFPFDNPSYSFGWKGISFRQFTIPTSQGSNGYCREAGKILSASGDSDLENILPKLHDDNYRVNASIFMFPVNAEAYGMMNRLSKKIPLKLYFKSIINKLQPADSMPKSTWNDVLSATTFQKFGDASSPDFPAVTASPVQDAYDTFNPDLVTGTATNYVTITRMTFRLDDFSVLNPEYVTHLFIFADALEISQTAKLSLPGSKKIYLVCREFVALSSANNVPEIIVGTHGQPDPVINIVAKEFHGILKVSKANEGTHLTYANKIVYKTVRDPIQQDLYTVVTDNSKKLGYPDRQTVPEMYETSETSHEGKWLRGSLVNSFELVVTSAETLHAVPSSSRFAQNIAEKSLEWITRSLTKCSNNESSLSVDLEMVLARVLLMGKTQLPNYAKSRPILHKLTFSQYQPQYESFLSKVQAFGKTLKRITREIQRRRQNEISAKSLKGLNTNVKSIGLFLVEQAEVNAKHQKDIADTQKSIYDLENDQIDREKAKANQLFKEIMGLQKDVEAKGIILKNAIENYQQERIIPDALAVIQVTGSLFTGGVGLTKIDEKLTGIVRIAKKVTNAMMIIEQVNKLYDLDINSRNDIGTINRALENIPSGIQIDKDTFLTELEWKDFDDEVYSFTTPGGFLPGQVSGEALELRRATKRLSSRGKKYISIAVNVAYFKYKKIHIKIERDLAKRQRNRLQKLKTRLTQSDLSDHDAKTTDLFELGNIIKMKENQVRSQLVQTIVVMDAALQYYYLQEPTLIERFGTMNIQKAASRQLQSALGSLGKLPNPLKDLEDPVKFDIPGVPVKDLLSKDGYKVSIPLSSSHFHEYVRVRILRIEVRADDISKSANNTAYIQATASGDLFQDRDLDRSPRRYSTFPTEFRTVYNIKTGEVIKKPSEEFLSRHIKISPFNDWVFRIPKANTNKGIQFKTALTTLRIKFYLRVIFHPSPLKSNDQYRSPGGKISDNVLGSTENLLGDMEGRSLVREWDAIMAVNAERVNRLWKKQYDEKTNSDFVQKIITDKKVSSRTRRTKIETRIVLEIGPPMVEFIQNNQHKAKLKIKIKKGTVEYWESKVGRGLVDHYNETLDVSNEALITGIMDLQKLRGLVSTEDKIILDLSNGVFGFVNVSLYDDVLLNSEKQLEIYFNNRVKSESYELAKITYEKSLTPASLVPDKFYLNTGGFGKDSLGSLFIFIKTHSPGATAHELTPRDFNDPLEINKQIIPAGHEVALFINNRIIFKDIIMEDIKKKFGFGLHTKILPLPDRSSSQQSLYVVGNLDAKRKFDITIPFAKYSDIDFKFTIPGNTLRAKSINKGKKIQVHWVNSGLPVRVPYATHECPGRSWCYDVIRYKPARFSTSYIKTFAPSIDRQQTITYNAEGSGSASSSAISAPFFFRSNFRHARRVITSKVNDYMKDLVFNFRSISTFAITQVLFPGNNVFHLTDVYIPGDMVILGTVNT